jgi:hypothetical protein
MKGWYRMRALASMYLSWAFSISVCMKGGGGIRQGRAREFGAGQNQLEQNPWIWCHFGSAGSDARHCFPLVFSGRSH